MGLLLLALITGIVVGIAFSDYRKSKLFYLAGLIGLVIFVGILLLPIEMLPVKISAILILISTFSIAFSVTACLAKTFRI